MSKQYKIAVYAMTKNEAQFAARWYDNVSEADYVTVLDTGSTDNTVEILRSKGAIVETKVISPWRFDVARNESMRLIPADADICVCVDLDELFEPGWADALRKHWQADTEKMKYLYTWNHDQDGNPLIQIWYEKIHDNSGNWYWAMPVHEALTFKLPREPKTDWIPREEMHLHHWPDLTKSRGQYLDLMQMGIQENPNDFMQQWYYGRELYYHRRYQDSINQLEYVKTMPFNNFEYQRSASLVFLGHAYKAIGDYKKAEESYVMAANQVDDVREPMLFLTQMYYELQRWYACVDAGLRTLDIGYSPGSWYEDKTNYEDKPHDYLSIAFYNIEDYEKSLYHIKAALSYKPHDERLQNNLKLIENKL